MHGEGIKKIKEWTQREYEEDVQEKDGVNNIGSEEDGSWGVDKYVSREG